MGDDDAAVALAADGSSLGHHLLHHVDLADRREKNRTVVGRGRVGNGLRGGEGGDDRAGLPRRRRLHRKRERVVLTYGCAARIDQRDAIGVRVNGKADGATVVAHGLAELAEVGGHRLWVVGKIAVGPRVDEGGFDAQGVQQARNHQGPRAIAGIDGHLEPGPANGIGIDIVHNLLDVVRHHGV